MFPSVACSALPFGRRKLRANPGATSTTSPRRPSFSTSSLTTMRMDSRPSLLIRRERDERQGPGPLDGGHHLALMLGAGARDPPRENLRALRDEPLQQPDVLVVDELDLLVAELAERLLA